MESHAYKMAFIDSNDARETHPKYIRVAAYTGGPSVPSARLRVRQYAGPLLGLGIQFSELTSRFGRYPPVMKLARPFWAVATIAHELPAVLRSQGYDITFLQREIVSTFLTLEPLTRRPRILDVDDAIFLHRGGSFARKLAGICEAVICGNSFLAEQFSQWNHNIHVLPTAVDTDRYTPEPSENIPNRKIIGWSGTSSGFRYLYAIEEALNDLLGINPDAKLRIVADRLPKFQKIPMDRVEYVAWSPEREVDAIRGMTTGIMPLDDSPWSRGKCSYKILTYMACAVPVVATPVGMNAEILSSADVGLPAANNEEWIRSLNELLHDRPRATVLGQNGRRLVERRFSLPVLVPQLAQIIRKYAK